MVIIGELGTLKKTHSVQRLKGLAVAEEELKAFGGTPCFGHIQNL